MASQSSWRWRLLLASLAIGLLGWVVDARECRYFDSRDSPYFKHATIAGGRDVPPAERGRHASESGDAASALLTQLPRTGPFKPHAENAVAFIECGEALEDAQAVWFVELRDERLRQIVEKPGMTHDVNGRPVFIRIGEDTQGMRARGWADPWDAARKNWLAPLRPDWFPADAWADGNQVGWLNGGALYRGASPEHFYWVRSRK